MQIIISIFSRILSTISRLHNLTFLNLSGSVFVGEIPSEITQLSKLSILDLSFRGANDMILELHDLSLAKLVQNLTYITHLHLDYVDISSHVPLILSNITSLESITLDGCNLLGDFPTSLFQLSKLEVVSSCCNPYLGGFFPEFHSSSPIRILSFEKTQFAGPLPPSIGNLGSLEALDLWACQFHGELPSSLGNLSRLTILHLGHNQFSGDLPSSITNLTGLTALTLSHLMSVNPRTLSSWMFKIKSLEKVGLSNMNLGNEILPALANHTDLDIWILVIIR